MLKLHSVVEKRLRPVSKKVNPFCVLPIELIWLIFEHLSFFDKLSCLGVSRQWSRALLSCGRFYSKIDMTCGNDRRLKYAPVLSYIKKARGNVQLLRTIKPPSPNTLRYLFASCHQLHTLHLPLQHGLLELLPQARRLRRLSLCNDSLYLETAIALMSHFTLLEDFTAILHPGKHPGNSEDLIDDILRNPDLATVVNLTFELLGPLALDDLFAYSRFPNLQSLMIREKQYRSVGWSSSIYDPQVYCSAEKSWPKSLRSLSFPISTIARPQSPSAHHSSLDSRTIHLPSNLTDLTLNCRGQPFTLIGETPCLRSLTLRHYHSGLDRECWMTMKDSLRNLILMGVVCEADVLEDILLHVQNLSSLSVVHKWLDTISESHLKLIVQRNPDLQQLELSYPRDLAGAMLAELVDGLKSLRLLIFHVAELMSPDLLEWIRSRDIQVKQILAKPRRRYIVRA